MSKKIEMIGKQFGRLTVIGESNRKGGRGQLYYTCKCTCGNIVEVMGETLRRGKTVSCGCYNRERAREVNTTHGGSKDRLYGVWQGMKDRCFNPNGQAYNNYGGRGIVVCDEWLDYNNFKDFMLREGYDESLAYGEQTIDRINVDGNYEPNNCRIVTKAEQAFNRTDNRLITHEGETKTATEWAAENSLDSSIVFSRLHRGWSEEDAISMPKTKNNRIIVGGESHTYKEWAQVLGIPWSTLRDHLNRKKMTMEQVVKKYRNN